MAIISRTFDTGTGGRTVFGDAQADLSIRVVPNGVNTLALGGFVL